MLNFSPTCVHLCIFIYTSAYIISLQATYDLVTIFVNQISIKLLDSTFWVRSFLKVLIEKMNGVNIIYSFICRNFYVYPHTHIYIFIMWYIVYFFWHWLLHYVILCKNNFYVKLHYAWLEIKWVYVVTSNIDALDKFTLN